MTFDYRNGEDYACVLCGERKHTLGPRPDKLCDGCWELKVRVELQPELARKVLRDLEVAHESLGHTSPPQLSTTSPCPT
jgi:hypothetical protein